MDVLTVSFKNRRPRGTGRHINVSTHHDNYPSSSTYMLQNGFALVTVLDLDFFNEFTAPLVLETKKATS